MALLANGVGMEGLALGCAIPFLFLMLVAGFETIILRLVVAIPLRAALRASLAANTFSCLGGLVVLWLFGGRFFFFEWAFGQMGFASAVERTWPRCLGYLVETLIVEWIVWWLATRKSRPATSFRLTAGVALANVASYALIYPLIVAGLSHDAG